MPKAKKGKGSSKSSKMTVVSERSCTYCPELFKTDYKLKQHVNETHVSHKIRGLKNKVKHKVGGDGGYQFTSHKLLLDYQTRFKDQPSSLPSILGNCINEYPRNIPTNPPRLDINPSTSKALEY